MDISLERLASLFLNKLKYIVLITVLVSVATYLVCDNLIEKRYTSESAMMIQVNVQSNQSTNNELSVTRQSVENYIRTLYTDNFFKIVADSVNEQMGSNYTYKQIKKNSEMKAGSSDRVSSDFNISYTASTPELAQKTLFIITDEAMKYLDEKNVTNPVDRIEDPSFPGGPSYPKTKDYTLYAFILSFVISVCLFFFKEIFDDRIKNVKDITAEYDLPVLGVIPDYTPSRSSTYTKASRSYTYSKEEKKKND